MDDQLTLNWNTFLSQALPLLLLAVAGIGVLFVSRAKSRLAFAIGGGAAAGAVLLAALRWAGASDALPQALFFFDRVAWTACMATAALLAMTCVVASRYIRLRDLPAAEFVALLLFATIGLWCMVATHHLLMLFVGIETLSIASYILAAYLRSDAKSIEAGLKYFLLGSVAAAFLLFGIAFVYGGTGSMDLFAISALSPESLGTSLVYARIGVACVLIGLSFKLALVPFQFWTPDVYAGAPLPISGFFATAVKIGGFIALWRVVGAMSGLVSLTLPTALWWLAVLTMTVGNLAALAQEDIKRMLAYSSIAHAGYAMIALVLGAKGQPASLINLLFYLVSYSVVSFGAFAILIAVSRAQQERTDHASLVGLSHTHPGFAAALALMLLSLAGIPPTLGFFGKYFLFTAAIDAGEVPLIIIAVINSVIAVAYYVRPIVAMYFTKSAQPAGAEATALRELPLCSTWTRALLICITLTILAAGLCPNHLLAFFLKSVQ